MARAAKTEQTTAIANWDAELAKYAERSAAMEANVGGGSFFSVRGGILALNDVAMPNNQMAVVILDSIIENAFYEGDYDAENITPPTCFAFGRDELTMAPHESVVAKGQDQHRTCNGCPMNAYGTAEKGRGKACGNRRRLGMIPAGTLDNAGKFTVFPDTDQFEAGAVAFMKLPPTSLKGYATFVKQVAGALKRPPFGIFTRVKVMPDPKTQFKVVFEPIAPVSNELMPTMFKRHEEAKSTIEVPYNLEVEEKPEPPAKAGRKPAANARPAVKKKY